MLARSVCRTAAQLELTHATFKLNTLGMARRLRK